jgi:hypothetical protein
MRARAACTRVFVQIYETTRASISHGVRIAEGKFWDLPSANRPLAISGWSAISEY